MYVGGGRSGLGFGDEDVLEGFFIEVYGFGFDGVVDAGIHPKFGVAIRVGMSGFGIALAAGRFDGDLGFREGNPDGINDLDDERGRTLFTGRERARCRRKRESEKDRKSVV